MSVDKPVRPASEVARLDREKIALMIRAALWQTHNRMALVDEEVATIAAAVQSMSEARDAEVRAAALEEAAQEVDSEPEMPGAIPDELVAKVLADPETCLRAVVRVTKKCINDRIRALATRSTEEPTK